MALLVLVLVVVGAVVAFLVFFCVGVGCSQTLRGPFEPLFGTLILTLESAFAPVQLQCNDTSSGAVIVERNSSDALIA